VAHAFVSAYREANPSDEIKTINVFDMDLPRFDGLALQAKYRILHGKDPTPEEHVAWKAVEDVIAEFTAADKYLISVPMWNFGIPYALKHYIDVLVQPGYTFSFSPEEGYQGLVTGRKAAVVYARGGSYADADSRPYDMQQPYVELILGFIGITDVTSVVVEPTLQDDEATVKEGLARARERAQELAANF
jgi:FMN-dependent NADH-azoreductase